MPQVVIDEIREHLVRIEKKLDHVVGLTFTSAPRNWQNGANYK